jgi:hypothetical protein
VVASDRSLTMSDEVMRIAVRYRSGLNPYVTAPRLCLCGKVGVHDSHPYHALSCSSLRHHGTNWRHDFCVHGMSHWIRRAGAIVRTEVTGMSSADNKRPDIVFWHDFKQHVVDVTVTDPFNETNSRRVGSRTSSVTQNERFDRHAAQFAMLHATVEKRKNKHYTQLVEENAAVFYTAGAFTTGGLCE